MSPVDLVDKRTLVVGGSGVLGSAIAAELSGRGAKVLPAGRDATRLQERARKIGPDIPSVTVWIRPLIDELRAS